MTRSLLARRLATALAAVPLLLLVPAAGPAAAAPMRTLQAEAMTLPPGAASFADAAAQGGSGVVLGARGSLTGTVRSLRSDVLTVRARGDQYRGSPQLVVEVDGVRAGTIDVASTAWKAYSLRGSWGKGSHTVRLSFVNDVRDSGGDRNLRIDAVTLSDSTAPTAYEQRIIDLVNAERGKAGLAALKLSPCATTYARQWSSTMASSGTFAHRTDLRAVMSACGARRVGENIAYGNVTADQMVRMWMDSPGHRANILRPEYTHIGVGAKGLPSGRVYGTQNFLTL